MSFMKTKVKSRSRHGKRGSRRTEVTTHKDNSVMSGRQQLRGKVSDNRTARYTSRQQTKRENRRESAAVKKTTARSAAGAGGVASATANSKEPDVTYIQNGGIGEQGENDGGKKVEKDGQNSDQRPNYYEE